MLIAHVVHNPARPERLKNILGQSWRNEFTAQLWAAEMNAPTPEAGCVLAHQRIVVEADRQNAPWVLIMEDDVMFLPSHTNTALEYFLHHMPREFDIYTAGTYGMAAEWTETGPRVGRLDRMSGTHCYMVSQRFYKRFMNLPITDHLDILLSKEAEIYMSLPMSALQLPGHSDIVGKYVDYNSQRFVRYPLFGDVILPNHSTGRDENTP